MCTEISFFVSLCSGSNGLRYEELPGEWFDYNKAFPTVTDFYGSSSANPFPTPSETADGETSPSSMDTTKMAEGTHVQCTCKCLYK